MTIFPPNLSHVHISRDGRRTKYQRGTFTVVTARPTRCIELLWHFEMLVLPLRAGITQKGPDLLENPVVALFQCGLYFLPRQKLTSDGQSGASDWS